MDAKQQKKREIADAARVLFADFGYKSVSMEQIAARANVAKGTLYLYYKDKEDLFYCLCREFISQISSFVKSIEDKDLSLMDEIHEVVYNLLMFRKTQKFLFRIAQEAKELKTPSACKVVKMIDGVIVSYLDKRLQKAISDGIIKPCNTSILSFVVIKVYSALAFEWEDSHEPLNEKEIAQSVSIFLKDGLFAQ